MPYDRTNPTHRAELYSEVTTDPALVGYEPKRTKSVMNGLNNRKANPGNEQQMEAFTPRLALDEIVVDELSSPPLSDGAQDWLLLIMSRPLDEDLTYIRPKFLATLPANSQSETNIRARRVKLTRAQVLWPGTVEISEEEWFEARDEGEALAKGVGR